MYAQGHPVRSRPGGWRTVGLLIALSALWMTFSGKTDAVHLTYGVVSVALTVLLSRRIVLNPSDPLDTGRTGHFHVGRAAAFLAWLTGQVLWSSVQVSWLIVRPSLPIDPVFITFRTGFRRSLAKVTLGNGIILTPGTFTLRIDGDRYLVHALHEDLAGTLLDGSFVRRVARVFGETPPGDLEIRVVRDGAGARRELASWSS